MSKRFENELKGVINAMVSKSEDEEMNLLKDTISAMEENGFKLNNPEYFYYSFNFKLERSIRAIIKYFNTNKEVKDESKFNFIYRNYNFLKGHLEDLLVLRTGHSCSADKSRFIINMYVEYTITGLIPDFDPEVEHYWIPTFGDYKDWMDFCDSLYELFYGKPNNYFIAYKKLLEKEIRRYSHTLHTWYIEFNDGETVKFDNSWDENIKNPLDNVYHDKGYYYIINEKLVKDRGYEEYIDEEESSAFIKFVKMPKLDIKKIYKISEEKLV